MRKPKGKLTAFIDADILLHRAVSFCDDEFDGEPCGDWRQAVHYFDKLLEKWLREAGKLQDYHLIISVGPNFRKDLYPAYKENRKDIIPHPAFEGLKNEVMERMDVSWELGIEADDLIGIRVTENKDTLAISADKDFATIPCNLMVPASHDRKKQDWYTFSEEDADRNWMIQTMTGDVIDNYPGIPGVGPVAASEAVDNPRRKFKASPEYFQRGPRKGQQKPEKWTVGAPCDVWTSMVTLAQSKGVSEDELILMAQLARILRAGDYDFETKEVKLWTPK